MNICILSMLTGPDKSDPYTNRLSSYRVTSSHAFFPVGPHGCWKTSDVAGSHHTSHDHGWGVDIMIDDMADQVP